jgi:hypothetical protein
VRRVSSFLLLSIATPAFVGLPTVTLPAAAAKPVAANIHNMPLSGVDAAGLAESPTPEAEPDEAWPTTDPSEGGTRGARVKRSPVAVTRRMMTSPFSAVGVSWAADARLPDVAVQVRTHSGKGWSAWTEVEVQGNAAPDAGAETEGLRAGSDPLYVGPSDGVQVRVDGTSVKPRDLQLALIDPGTSGADEMAADGRRTLGGSQAQAAVSAPAYVSRAGWGAVESYRTCTPSASSTIKGGILHTTATGNAYTATDTPAIMRSMYAYHTRSLGWCDIGYNFLVDKYGTLYEGRYGGVGRAVIGAHTGGFNTATFGVSMIGNHDLAAPTSAQVTTVEKVFAWKLAMYGHDPEGTTTYTSAGGSATKYPARTVVTKPVISGHRDYSTKSCPGNLAYPLLPKIRAEVAALIARSGTATTGQSPAAVATSAMTLSASPASLSAGATTTMSGQLTADGAPLPGRQVEVYVSATGSAWSLLGKRTTSITGTFSLEHAPTSTLTYSARFAGDAKYTASRRDLRVTVTPKVVERAATSLTAAPSSATVTYGSKTTLRGTLSRKAGPALAGKPVRLYVKYGSGAWALAGTGTTASNGAYAIAHAPRARATYGLRFAGDAANLAASRDVAVKVATKVTVSLSSPAAAVGRTVRVSGTVSPAHPGQLVQRQQRIGGVWTSLASARLSSAGRFTFTLRPATRGTKYYRVVGLTDADHVAGASATRFLAVR